MPVNRDQLTGSQTPLLHLLNVAAENRPDATALVQGDTRINYSELVALVECSARDLRGRGVSPGHLVALRFPNSIAYIVLTYAVWRCGGVVVPIAVELTAIEVDQIFSKIKPHFFISNRNNTRAASMVCSRIKTPYFLEQCTNCMDDFDLSLDPAFIRFTSGTTGAFKGVVLGHTTIVERITALNHVLQIGAGDTVVWVLSMAHHFVSTIVLYLSTGASIVLSSGIPAERILNDVEKEKATLLYAAPFHYALMAADASSRKMPSIRMAISTTVGLSESVFVDFYKRFGLSIRQAYGIIETGLVGVNTELSLEKSSSVGRALPGYEIEIRNFEQPRENETPFGRIFVKGPGFFDAYLSPFRSAGKILDNGWFDTGDIGRIDSEGFVYILGRYKEIINAAGMKVFPQEVEQVLNEHPAVGESHVFSSDNSRYGETVAAEVTLSCIDVQITESELRSYCRSRLATYKVPESIRCVERIAKTVVTSKIIRQRPETEVKESAEDRCHGASKSS